MERLSLELLYCVLDNFKGKRSTLKTVRLVNRTLAAAAAPFLFHTLLVYQTPRSWEKVSLIARCPCLAKHVVKLELAALIHLPHFLDFLDWKKCTWSLRWSSAYLRENRAAMVALLVEERETSPSGMETQYLNRQMPFEDWRQQPEVRKRKDQLGMGIVAHLSSECRVETESSVELRASNLEVALGLVYGYERYRYWHDGEIELLDLLYSSQDPQPLLDLRPLPNLQTVAVLGSHNLWTISTIELDRKFRESRVGINWARFEGDQNDVHMNLALRMLDACEVHITRLELNRYSELLGDLQFSVPPLKNLQELVLDLPYFIDYNERYYVEVHNYRGQWELPNWLRGADDLQTIVISSQGPEEDCCQFYFDVIALFHGVEWRRLQRVNFNETYVRPKSLLHFLSEHTRSLTSIHVDKPKMSKVAWQSLASEFQALEFSSPHCILHVDVSDQYGDIYPPERLGNDSNWIDRTNRPSHLD